MQDIVEVTGMIIQNIPVKDYDRRITILTRENGKIGAFVRGARRQNNSRFGHFLVYSYLFPDTIQNVHNKIDESPKSDYFAV